MRKTLPAAAPVAISEGGGKRSPSKPPPDPAELLRKEVDIMRSLRHPNIVALHEASFKTSQSTYKSMAQSQI